MGEKKLRTFGYIVLTSVKEYCSTVRGRIKGTDSSINAILDAVKITEEPGIIERGLR